MQLGPVISRLESVKNLVISDLWWSSRIVFSHQKLGQYHTGYMFTPTKEFTCLRTDLLA